MRYKMRILFSNGHLEEFVATHYHVEKQTGATGIFTSVLVHAEHGDVEFANVVGNIIMVRAEPVD